jgi:hypothetical protein
VSRIGPAVIGLNHSWSCAKPDGAELDLHWWANKTPGDDSGIFEGAREALLLEHRVLVPSATDCLVITVAGAFFPDQGSPLRWITDSMLLFEAGGDGIDWDTVLNRARRPGLTLGLAAGLEFLAREFSAPVPDYVIDELHRRPVSWQERAAHWAALNRPQVGVYFISHFLRQNARRRHYSAGLPRDLLWHLAQITRGPQGRRRDLLKRAPKTAVRKTAVLAVGYGSRATSRQR